jgi:hypothetical protein
MGFMVDAVTLRHVLSTYFDFPLVNYHSTNAPFANLPSEAGTIDKSTVTVPRGSVSPNPKKIFE